MAPKVKVKIVRDKKAVKVKVVREPREPAVSVGPLVTREDWLQRAITLLRPIFLTAGTAVPTHVYVSTGFPSTRALSRKNQRIGECWSGEASTDQRGHIFISPVLDDAATVLATLVHELVHAAAGTKAGHKGAFRCLAKAVGLEGKMTSTTAGEGLKGVLAGLAEGLGGYPHGKLNPLERPTKKQGVRQRKAQCDNGECGMIIRTTKKWIEEVGLPKCECGEGVFVAEESDEDEDEEGEGEGE